jgi:hypothetical protein
MFVIGCGGGGGKKAMIVDAMVDSPTIDAAGGCSVNCELSAQICGPSFNMPAFPSLTFGSTKNTCRMATTTTCTTDAECEAGNPNDFCDTRVDGNWFVNFTEAPLAGHKAFNIGLIMDENANPDVLFIRLMKPDAGAFPLNTDTTFDPNPATQIPVAWSFWFGNATIDNAMGTITDAEQFYYANMGSIKLTMVGENDGAMISGSTTSIAWREVDDANADVPGGCTATMGMAANGFAFNLLQKSAAFQPQEHKGYPRQVSPALAESLNKYIDAKMAKLRLQQY